MIRALEEVTGGWQWNVGDLLLQIPEISFFVLNRSDDFTGRKSSKTSSSRIKPFSLKALLSVFVGPPRWANIQRGNDLTQLLVVTCIP